MKTIFALLLSIATACAVTLGWDFNTETYLGGYILHWGLVSGQPSVHKDVGKVAEFVPDISAFKAGDQIFFTVTAYNTENKEGLPSNEVFYVVPTPLPGAPANLRFKANVTGVVEIEVIP